MGVSSAPVYRAEYHAIRCFSKRPGPAFRRWFRGHGHCRVAGSPYLKQPSALGKYSAEYIGLQSRRLW